MYQRTWRTRNRGVCVSEELASEKVSLRTTTWDRQKSRSPSKRRDERERKGGKPLMRRRLPRRSCPHVSRSGGICVRITAPGRELDSFLGFGTSRIFNS